MDIDRRPSELAARAGLAMAVSVISGLLVAGLALPVVGGGGLLARKTVEAYYTLPSELPDFPLAQTSKILRADGKLLAEVKSGQDRLLTTIDKIPPVMIHALLAIEDARFYEHRGLDLKGVVRAAWKNRQSGQVEQGASTLTQQYVKNALLYSAQTEDQQRAAIEQTPRRKLHEARIAMEIERTLTKDQILERYLNIAYFGNGVYGVRTAAQFYFYNSVDRLTLSQSAILAGLVQSPSRYDPINRKEAALARRNLVLSKMAQVFPCRAGVQPSIEPCYSESAPAAAQLPLGLRIRPKPENKKSIAPYFLDYVQEYLLSDGSPLGKTKEEREHAFFRGGLTIRTTLDPAVQDAATKALESTDIKDKEPHAAIVVIEPGTGNIRAMAVNVTPKSDRSLNLATGGQSGMQGGSTFKVFVLAAALEMDMPLGTTFHSPATYVSPVFDKLPGVPYDVHNAGDSQSGLFNMLSGTWHSVNTYFIQLEEATGIQKPVQLARAMMGKNPAVPLGKARETQPSFVLGSAATSVIDVANAYATVAARGIACDETSVLEILDATGKPLKLPGSQCTRVLKEKTADTLAYILKGVIDGRKGTGFRASIGRPAAGKTGSATNYTSAFFAGFTPDYAAAVWMGDSLAPNKKPLLNVEGVEQDFSRVFGGTFPAIIWKKTMLAIHEGKPERDFVAPPAEVLKTIRVPVPAVGGMTPDEARSILRDAGLNSVVSASGRINSIYPINTVAATSPAAGARVQVGTVVTIFVSNGLQPVGCGTAPGQLPCPPPCVAVAGQPPCPPPAAGTPPAVTPTATATATATAPATAPAQAPATAAAGDQQGDKKPRKK